MGPDMTMKASFLSRSVWAVSAGKWLLSSVGSYMLFQVLFSGGGVGTLGTSKWFLSSVCSNVVGEVSGGGGLVGAVGARVSLPPSALHPYTTSSGKQSHLLR